MQDEHRFKTPKFVGKSAGRAVFPGFSYLEGHLAHDVRAFLLFFRSHLSHPPGPGYPPKLGVRHTYPKPLRAGRRGAS